MCYPVMAQVEPWPEIRKEDKQTNSPTVTAGAPVEFLFCEEIIEQSISGVVRKIYVRAKIFDERGIGYLTSLRVAYASSYKLVQFEARVAQPDGSVLMLPRTEVISTTVERDQQSKTRSESFALPNLKVGSIVDYRYTLTADGTLRDWRLVLQREAPAREITFRFKGDRQGDALKVMRLGVRDYESFREKGYTVVRIRNVEPIPDEPHLPPPWNHVPSLLLYYENESAITPDKYWDRFGKNFHWFFDGVESNDEIRRVGQQIVAGAQTEDEKINRILVFCRTKIKNLSFDPELDPQKLRRAIDENADPTEVLRKGEGTDHCIDKLFASFAEAVGLEVRLVFSGDRRTFFFMKSFPRASLVRYMGLAVRSDSGWHLCNPGMIFVPNGRLHWYSEGQDAMLIGRNDFVWSKLPLSSPAFNRTQRKARLTLGADGGVEGHVTMFLYGQIAEKFRSENYRRKPDELRTYVRDAFIPKQDERTLSDVVVRNMDSQTEPVQIEYSVKVSGYGQVLGKRLIFEPDFFSHEEHPRFEASSRKSPVYFELLASDLDEIEFDVPKGFEMEALPRDQHVNDDPGIARLVSKSAYDPGRNTVKFERLLTNGENGQLLYSASEYPRIKRVYDAVAIATKTVISLRKQ